MMLVSHNFLLSFFTGLLLFSSCRQPAINTQNSSTSAENPSWLRQIIWQFEDEKPANPPVKIYRYRYRNQLVYFITGRCCDIPGRVLNVQGQQLCQPDGGITGRGDGKCADFFEARTDEKLVWEDLRK